MGSQTDAERILGECSATSSPGIYVVGSLSRGVSFVTQQLRALNLVWALFETRKLAGDSVVAVIGGGLAGLTASAALRSKGCRVILYEASDSLMRMQANSKLRYVHPYAHIWPDPLASNPKTDLPFLNWQADTAHRIRQRVLKQWAQHFERDVDLRKQYEVSTLSIERGKPVVTYGRPRFGRDGVDCVITTVGFGVERPSYSHPYWEPDGLEYRLTSAEQRIWLVAGCGDGGLVDVLRLRFDDFDYQSAMASLSSVGTESLRESVEKIEQAGAQFLDLNDRGGYLFEAYRKLSDEMKPEPSARLLAGLRGDTLVHMVSPHPTPFSTTSMPINRMLISILLSKDTAHGLQYHQGRCGEENIRTVAGINYVELSEVPTKVAPIGCHQVLFRYGPEPVLDRIVSENSFRELRERHAPLTGPTLMAKQPFWPPEFYPVAAECEPETITVPEGKLAGGAGPNAENIKTLYCGALIQGPGSSTGTLGCFVAVAGGGVGFLSTAHVLTGGGRGKVGNPVRVLDENGAHEIGTVHSFVNIRRGRHSGNLVDAAIAVLAPGISRRNGFAPVHNVPLKSWLRSPVVGEKVFKVGAASGLTFGTVVDVSFDTMINDGEGGALFVDAFRIEPTGGMDQFGQVGDSGALVVAEDGAPIGLLFAFGAQGRYAVACPIEAVCAALSCEVLAPLPERG